MRKLLRSTVFYVVLAVVVLLVVFQAFGGKSDRQKLSLSAFERRVAAGQVRTAEVSDRDHEVKGTLSDNTKFKATFADRYTDNVIDDLRRLSAAGSTVVTVTHSDRIATQADRVIQLQDGRSV